MIEALLAAAFGLLIGSFLNVCIYRLPRDLSVVAPRSFCPECGRQIAWFDNVPLLSFALRGGKCRYCGVSISWRYPIVETLTAAAFFSAVAQHGMTPEAFRLALFSCCLITLFFTDYETYILPDEITLGGAMAGIFLAIVYPQPAGLIGAFLPPQRLPAGESLANAVFGGAIPAVLLWSIAELYLRFRNREGLGFGDVKMMLLLGAFSGLEGALLTLIVGSVVGSLMGLALLAIRGRRAATHELPFGSFLAAAALLLAHLGWTGRLY